MINRFISTCNRCAVAVFLLFGLVFPSIAQTNFPNKPVKLIVSFPPGGFADLVGRSVAQALSQLWGQPVVVDNKPGGAGILATELAAKANPDGYTLYLATDGPFVINPYLYKSLPYHPINDFIPTALVAYTPLVLIVNPEKISATNLRDWVNEGRNPNKPMDYGSGGAGGPHHLGMEALRIMTSMNLNHIPYKGGAPALQDLLSGQIGTMFSAVSSSLPHAKSGKVRILASGGFKRSAIIPDVPTIAESGFPGYEAGAWAGIVAPKGTPQPIVDKIELDVLRISRDQQFILKLTSLGADSYVANSSEFRDLIRRDQIRYSKLIQDLNIKAD